VRKEEIRELVFSAVSTVLSHRGEGEVGDIPGDEPVLTSLDLESVEVVGLLTAVRTGLGGRNLPFQELVFRDGQAGDFTLHELVDFIHAHLETGP